ncbi:MAG: sigma-E factor negative regulatory protein [Pseudomonadota bacterium]
MSEQDKPSSVASQIELQLSAFVDGELTPAEAEFLSRRIGNDETLRRRLQQYYLIGSVARGEQPVPRSFSSGLAARLDDTELPASTNEAQRGLASQQGWQRLAGGGAIAAGVALLALVTLNQTVEQPSPAPRIGDNIGETVPPLRSDTFQQPQITLSEPRLVNYMLQHGQIATPLIVETVETELAAEAANNAAEDDGAEDVAAPRPVSP